MPISLQTEVRMVKGVGPQRAELLGKRGIYTLEDLLNYLPFRYEDRIHFSRIKDVQPGGTYTLRARVMSGQAARGQCRRRPGPRPAVARRRSAPARPILCRRWPR